MIGDKWASVAIGLGLLVLHSACTSVEAQRENGARPQLKVYGEFCGPGYPRNSSGNIEGHLKALAEIKPKDSVDYACQQHDMCYTLFGRELMCDAVLEYQLSTMRFDEEIEGECDFLAYAIVQYFKQLNPAKSSVSALDTFRSAQYKLGSMLGPTPTAMVALGLKATKGYPGPHEFCNDLTPAEKRYPPWVDVRGIKVRTPSDELCMRRGYIAYVEADRYRAGNLAKYLGKQTDPQQKAARES